MALIKLAALTKSFTNGHEKNEVIHKTDLELNAGKFLALTGPSGSGKTTLLTIIGALQAPSTGKIWFDGQDISTLSEAKRSKLRLKEFGFILQASNLIPFLTVQEQLILVDKLNKQAPQTKWQKELLERLGIWERRNSDVNDLSGGEKQRAAIARALYGRPKIIFADEPTASLDSKRAVEVVKMFADLAHQEDVLIIMITHDERLLQYCDETLYMIDGNLQSAANESKSNNN